jgi:DNA topoisomerase III
MKNKLNMTSVFSVAEKPSVAKELTAIIGKCNPDAVRRQGFSPYNPVFEINSCQFRGLQSRMTMTSVSGHLMQLEFEAQYRSWTNFSPLILFDAPIRKEVKPENELIKKTLMTEAKKHNVLLLWLDCDLEGENIAFEVIQACREANPRLEIYRARFSALIPRDIFRTMENPDRPNAHMNDAVDVRQEIDLRIGSAFTRFQTLYLQKRFGELAKNVISYGPCQFPTLGFVVQRHQDIAKFIPQKFWHLTCEGEFDHPDDVFSMDEGKRRKFAIQFNWDRHRFYDRLACLILYEYCLEFNALAEVVTCHERPTSRRKPIPLNTIDFQILASRSLRISSERAMNIAEALYQRGIVSYPRTETNFFQENFELFPLLQDHRDHSLWGPFTVRLLDQGLFEWPRDGGKNDQAHPPIHPTKSVELQTLENDEERAIYELITRHFLAACSKDARGNLTSVTIEIPSKSVAQEINTGLSGELFHTSGLIVLERNYLDVYSKFDFWNSNKLPHFQIGQQFTPKSFWMKEGETCPPEPLKEADLIALMDKNGIGTDATIAQHIATIQTREYVTKQETATSQFFLPNPLGLALVEAYNNMGYQLNRPELRAMIEKDCQKVAKGEMAKELAIKQCLSIMKQCFITCNKEVDKLDQAMKKYYRMLGKGQENEYQIIAENFTKCGKCGQKMTLKAERQNYRQNDNNNNNNNNNPGTQDPNRFVFCLQCDNALLVPSKGDLSAHELSCVICQYQVIIIKNRETQKEHTICPYCYNYPPSIVAEEGLQDFR